MKVLTVKITERRTLTVLVAFLVFAAFLIVNIFKLTVLEHEYYRNKVFDQVTTSTPLPASRGNIYDSNMNILAESNTSWRVFVSPKEIRYAEKEYGIDYAKKISEGLSEILSLSYDSLYKKITTQNVLDVTLKQGCSRNEYLKTVEFINNNGIDDLLFTEATTKREYPGETLAAHVLGFTGSDNQGLYGLEYFYDDILSGEDGYYLYAKDANGRALDTEYSSYFPAKDGYSIVTTLDSYIQGELEAILEKITINHNVTNRVCGIVMDTNTGAILGMATSSPFNPNSPFVLDDISQAKLEECGHDEGSPEYKAYKNELLQIMWSNKAVSETYEPGSTFKIVTVSSALDLGVASINDSFSCKGYKEVGGWRIRCHKAGGHGTGFSLSYGLQMSCNPCMISLSERVGSNSFYSYVEKFGYFEKTGIDLPSEGSTIFHKEENIGPTELATASFGQRFKVTVINQLTAISAVANGGKLVTPYVVDKIIDSNGRIISTHETNVRRQVISEDVAKTVSKILIEGVDGDGGAKNAGVSGYSIAAKTGTSQKFDILDENGNSYLRIGSTVAYSSDSERGVSTIIVVDEPNSDVKYGSVVAAPYVSELLEKVLPYLDFRTDLETPNMTVENYVGMNVETAKTILSNEKIPFEIIGNGDTVLSQTPKGDDVITFPISKIILYTCEHQREIIEIPKLIGLPLSEAIRIATNTGLNIKLAGNASASPSADDIVIEQSIPYGEKRDAGCTIILRSITKKYED